MSVVVTIRQVDPADLKMLTIFSCMTFFDAFFHLNHPEDMLAYADEFLTEQKLAAEMSHPASAFYFALIGNEIVGYIKLNFAAAQTDLKDNTSLEVERIYVSKYHQGKQIGKMMMKFAERLAVDEQLRYIWLGVWEQNHRAIAFYKRYGFEQFGSHAFMLGRDKQTDVLMKKLLRVL